MALWRETLDDVYIQPASPTPRLILHTATLTHDREAFRQAETYYMSEPHVNWSVVEGTTDNAFGHMSIETGQITRALTDEETQTYRQERENGMALEADIKYHRNRIEELEHRAALAERLGSDEDYELETVLYFERNFGKSHGRWYRYVALKATSQVWYVTGAQAGWRMTFDQLVEKYLVPALEEGGKIYYAKKWMEL